MRHDDAVNLVLLEGSRLGWRLARHFTGLVYPAAQVRNGQVVGRPRLVGLPGHADTSGRTSYGRAVAVEVKVGRDTLTTEQRTWRAAWIAGGGLYAECHPDRAGWQQQLRELDEAGRC